MLFSVYSNFVVMHSPIWLSILTLVIILCRVLLCCSELSIEHFKDRLLPKLKKNISLPLIITTRVRAVLLHCWNFLLAKFYIDILWQNPVPCRHAYYSCVNQRDMRRMVSTGRKKQSKVSIRKGFNLSACVIRRLSYRMVNATVIDYFSTRIRYLRHR